MNDDCVGWGKTGAPCGDLLVVAIVGDAILCGIVCGGPITSGGIDWVTTF